MSAIKNVIVVGGSGHLGTFILQKLLASVNFNVKVLKRAGSSSTYVAGAKAVETDFTDFESLKAAFQGQDAVVSVVGEAGIIGQKLMVDAAIAAGVKRFIPSNFGSNMSNPNSRLLPVFAPKVAVEEYLIAKAKTTELTYSFVYTGVFTDFAIEKKIIMDFSSYQPTIFGSGNTEFSSTSLPTIGDAVVGVLTRPMETRNRSVYVSEIILSQNKLLSMAKRIAPGKPWNPVIGDLTPMVESAKERFAQGQHDLRTAFPMLIKSLLDPEFGAKFIQNDNELLGINTMKEEYVVELLTPMIN